MDQQHVELELRRQLEQKDQQIAKLQAQLGNTLQSVPRSAFNLAGYQPSMMASASNPQSSNGPSRGPVPTIVTQPITTQQQVSRHG